jgi:hypothetical protein
LKSGTSTNTTPKKWEFLKYLSHKYINYIPSILNLNLLFSGLNRLLVIAVVAVVGVALAGFFQAPPFWLMEYGGEQWQVIDLYHPYPPSPGQQPITGILFTPPELVLGEPTVMTWQGTNALTYKVRLSGAGIADEFEVNSAVAPYSLKVTVTPTTTETIRVEVWCTHPSLPAYGEGEIPVISTSPASSPTTTQTYTETQTQTYTQTVTVTITEPTPSQQPFWEAFWSWLTSLWQGFLRLLGL